MTAGRWQGDHYRPTRGLDERDPAPETPHEPVSSKWAREEAKRATAEAVRKAKEKGGRL